MGAVVSLFVIVVLYRCRGALSGALSRAPYVGGDDESSIPEHVVDIDPPASPSATAAAGPSTAAAGLATIVTNTILFVAEFTTEIVGTRR